MEAWNSNVDIRLTMAFEVSNGLRLNLEIRTAFTMGKYYCSSVDL